MASDDKVIIGLSHGLDDAESVLISYLMAVEGLRKGKQVLLWLTKDGVHVATEGFAAKINVPDAPVIADLHEEYLNSGGRFYACPVCVKTRGLSTTEQQTAFGCAPEGQQRMCAHHEDRTTGTTPSGHCSCRCAGGAQYRRDPSGPPPVRAPQKAPRNCRVVRYLGRTRRSPAEADASQRRPNKRARSPPAARACVGWPWQRLASGTPAITCSTS